MIFKSYCMQTGTMRGIMASYHTGNLSRNCRTNDAAGIENSLLCIYIMYEGGLSVANFIFCHFLEKCNTK